MDSQSSTPCLHLLESAENVSTKVAVRRALLELGQKWRKNSAMSTRLNSCASPVLSQPLCFSVSIKFHGFACYSCVNFRSELQHPAACSNFFHLGKAPKDVRSDGSVVVCHIHASAPNVQLRVCFSRASSSGGDVWPVLSTRAHCCPLTASCSQPRSLAAPAHFSVAHHPREPGHGPHCPVHLGCKTLRRRDFGRGSVLLSSEALAWGCSRPIHHLCNHGLANAVTVTRRRPRPPGAGAPPPEPVAPSDMSPTFTHASGSRRSFATLRSLLRALTLSCGSAEAL